METMKDIKAQFASAKEGEYNALFQHYENDEPKSKFFDIQNVIFDRADIGKTHSHFLIFKLWPENSWCIQKLYAFIQADPLFTFCNSRFIAGLGAGFSCKGIDKC